MVDKTLLDNIIANSGKKKEFLAEKCGLSRSGFYLKCNGQTDFTAREIKVLCDELKITSLKLKENIFFANDVP